MSSTTPVSASLFSGVLFFLASSLSSEERIALRHLLETHGAGAAPLEDATHVITHTPNFEGMGNASDKAIAVTRLWVERCIVQDKLLPPDGYSPDPDKIFSGVVACAAELPNSDVDVLSAGITALGGTWRNGLTREITHMFVLTPGSEKYNIAMHVQNKTRIKVLHPLWFDDSIRSGVRGLPTAAYEFPDPPVVEARGQGVPFNIPAQPSLSVSGPSKNAWGALRVLFSPDLDLHDGRKQTVELGVIHCGGSVVEYEDINNVHVLDFDVLIARYRASSIYVKAVREGKLVGSLIWLFHVQSTGKISNPTDHLLHYPVPKDAIGGFDRYQVTVTNYQGSSREYLKRLIELAGATFTPSLSDDNAALIAACLSGNKADKARSWKVPIVNKDWLEDCFVAWKVLPLDEPRYSVFPDSDVAPDVDARGLDANSLLAEAEVIAEVERRADEFASLDVKDRPAPAEPDADAMDVDEPTSQPKRHELTSERIGESSQSDDKSQDAVATVSDGGVRRPVSRRKAKPISMANDDDTDDTDDTDTDSAPDSAPTHRLRKSNGNAPSSFSVASPRKSLSSSAKRPRRRKNTSPRLAPVAMDLGESDDEELLKGPSISPRRKAARPSDSEKKRSPPTLEASDEEPATRSPELAKVKAKGKERAMASREDGRTIKPSPRAKKGAPLSATAEPVAMHPAGAAPTRRSKPSAPVSRSKLRSSAHDTDSDGNTSDDADPRRRSLVSVATPKGNGRLPADGDSDGAATDAVSEPSHNPPTSSAPSSDVTTPTVAGRSRRSAATKATQRLHDEIMPDVVNFQKELRRGNIRALGEKEREAELRARAKEDKSEKRRRTSEPVGDEEVESEPGAKKRKVDAKGKEKAKAVPQVDERSSAGSPDVRVMTTGTSLADDVNRKLHHLGVRSVSNPKDCTHLIVNRIARTEKFLCAMAVGPVVVDERWAKACVLEKELLPADSDEYRLHDSVTEKKYKFKLTDALRRAKENEGNLFEDMTFFVTPKVSVDMKLLKNVIIAHGGKVKTQNPTARILEGKEDHYVISCVEDISIWRPIAEAGYTIYTTELILTSALVQEIRWKDPVNVLK